MTDAVVSKYFKYWQPIRFDRFKGEVGQIINRRIQGEAIGRIGSEGLLGQEFHASKIVSGIGKENIE
jgi:hypothetical protein